MTKEYVDSASTVFKLLGHPLRLRLVELLELYKEVTVTGLVELTGRPKSTVSFSLNRLKRAGLLKVRRVSNERYYSLAQAFLPNLIKCIRDCE